MPRVIVIHYTAGHEGYRDAENGAGYDQARTDGTSSHYYHDADSTVQCVYTWDEAHTALQLGNDVGIHHELAGTRQTREQWLDTVSAGTIERAARQAARDAAKYRIPVRRMTPLEVRAARLAGGAGGFCGHADITAAFPEDAGDHLDPGTEFPWDVFLARVQFYMDGDDMSQQAEDVLVALRDGLEKVDGQAFAPHQWQMQIHAHFAELATKVDGLVAVIQTLAAGGTSVDTAAVLRRLDEVAQEQSAREIALRATVDALAGRLRAAGVGLSA
jgi:hypothetical protein